MKSFEKYYNDYWEKRLETKDDELPPIRDTIPRPLIKYSQYGSVLNLVPEKSKLLDLGCGEGNITELYRLQKGCETHGLELSSPAIARAQDRGVITQQWNLNESPYPHSDETFDVVIAIDVLEHLINPFVLLNQAHRILKTGGQFIVQVPNFARLENRMRMCFKGDPLDILHWGGYGDGMEHLHWFTKPKLFHHLKESGFHSTHFHPVGLPFDFLYGKFGRFNWARLLLSTSIK